MLDYIKGHIEHIEDDHIVIESNDIGYHIKTSTTTIQDLTHQGDKVCIYTEMVVREDSITLCGFSTRDELKMFRLLTSVSGVGTKVGMGILSSIPYTSLYTILIHGDTTALTAANGVGKKTAQRIVLELKDKVEKTMHITVDHGYMIQEVLDLKDTSLDDAKSGLLSLGYSQNEVNHALKGFVTTNLSTEDIIKLALKELMNS